MTPIASSSWATASPPTAATSPISTATSPRDIPGRDLPFIALGLPSETLTGLTEPGHPFPRPNVHSRLAAALEKTDPDVVLACYGMNDGIYAPFSRERFGRYQDGVISLVALCRKAGAKVFLVTPPPFDADAIRDKIRPADATDHGWLHPFADYDRDVLAGYSQWLITLGGVNFPTIDARGPIVSHLQKSRNDDPSYRLSGDGVHVNSSGQWLIAGAILDAWDVPKIVDEAMIDAKSLTVSRGDVTGLKAESGGVQFSWMTKIPMPHDPDWDAHLAERERIDARFNRHLLTVSGLSGDRFAIYEGPRRLGQVRAAELASGVDLLKFPELSTNRRSVEVGDRIRHRMAILGPSWRDFVGHTRPDTGKGMPMEEAKRATGAMTEEIARLTRPVPVELRIVAE